MTAVRYSDLSNLALNSFPVVVIAGTSAAVFFIKYNSF